MAKTKGILFLSIFVAVVVLSASMSVMAAESRKEFVINALSAPLGSGDVETEMGIAALLKQKHPWLRLNAQETAGYGFNFKAMVEENWRRKDTMIHTDTFTPKVAEKKEPPYDMGLKGWSHLALLSANWIPQFMITSNPKIKTLEDLKGKRVASGLKAGNISQICIRVMKTIGLFDKITWQYVAFSQQIDMLNDGLVDAAWVYTYVNPVTNEFGHSTMITEAQSSASTRPYHVVGVSDGQAAVIEKAGYGLHVYKMPANILGGKEAGTINAIAHVGIIAADVTFPNDVAYEFVKFILNNINDVSKTGGYARTWKRDSLAQGVQDIMHPGAARAYKEAGLIK